MVLTITIILLTLIEIIINLIIEMPIIMIDMEKDH